VIDLFTSMFESDLCKNLTIKKSVLLQFVTELEYEGYSQQHIYQAILWVGMQGKPYPRHWQNSIRYYLRKNHTFNGSPIDDLSKLNWIFINSSKKYELVATDAVVIKKVRGEVTSRIEQLVDSIAGIGLINPIIVNSQYELISGYHRLQAMRSLDKEFIPAIIRDHGELVEFFSEHNNLDIYDIEDLLEEIIYIQENLFTSWPTRDEREKMKSALEHIYSVLFPKK
jgi:hypothetical protein